VKKVSEKSTEDIIDSIKVKGNEVNKGDL